MLPDALAGSWNADVPGREGRSSGLNAKCSREDGSEAVRDVVYIHWMRNVQKLVGVACEDYIYLMGPCLGLPVLASFDE